LKHSQACSGPVMTFELIRIIINKQKPRQTNLDEECICGPSLWPPLIQRCTWHRERERGGRGGVGSGRPIPLARAARVSYSTRTHADHRRRRWESSDSGGHRRARTRRAVAWDSHHWRRRAAPCRRPGALSHPASAWRGEPAALAWLAHRGRG
jgi:hypothetical protein